MRCPPNVFTSAADDFPAVVGEVACGSCPASSRVAVPNAAGMDVRGDGELSACDLEAGACKKPTLPLKRAPDLPRDSGIPGTRCARVPGMPGV